MSNAKNIHQPKTRNKAATKSDAAPTEKVKPEEEKVDDAIGLIMETVETLHAERGDRDMLWGSMVKQALKRRRPGFNERYYEARSFSDFLEEAERGGLIGLTSDERSGGYIIRKLDDQVGIYQIYSNY